MSGKHGPIYRFSAQVGWKTKSNGIVWITTLESTNPNAKLCQHRPTELCLHGSCSYKATMSCMVGAQQLLRYDYMICQA